MIAQYEQEKTAEMDSPAIYAIGQGHKHLPEMRKICGLDHAPVFCPVVDDYYKGMVATVSFHADQLKGINGPEGLRQCLAQHYAGQKLVQVAEAGQGMIDGGGPEITELLHKIGKETQFVDGLRVTDQETVEAAQMVLCGKISKSLVNLLQCCGGKAMGLSGLDGHMILAKQKDTHLGFVGEITKVDPQPILDVLDAGSIPAVSTMGCDEQGNTYNINADTAAAKLAGTLNAESFVALTDINGLLLDKNDPSTLISHITVEKTKKLIAQGVISDGMIPKVKCCMDAIEDGVRKVFIIDGRVPHSILIETLTDEGIGTMFQKEERS